MKKKAAISKHVANIFSQGELSPDMTVSKMETVVSRGFRGQVIDRVDYYNLDMILSIGYRVNSKRAIAFRQQILNIVQPCLISQTAVHCIVSYEFLFRYRHSKFYKWLAKVLLFSELCK